jgi:hypothetical protein
MDLANPFVTPVDAVRALFSAGERRWAGHDALLIELARRCGLGMGEAERAVDGLLADGCLDAITMCDERMVAESGYQPGPRLAYARGARAVA